MEALVVLIGSFVISWVSVDLSIRAAKRVNAYDHPDGGRKVQEHPIPRLGGLAIAGAFTLIIAIGLMVTGRLGFALALGVLIPALVAAAIGLADDRWHLNPYLRLGGQAGVGVLAWALGTRVAVTGLPAVDLAITVLWVMVIINGINLLDNSDGLAASTILVMGIGSSVIAAMFGQALVSLFGVVLVGVSLGYLRHNWHPAKVYMGDSGAYFLGSLAAMLLIRLTPEKAPGWGGLAIVVLLALLPLADTAYVTLTRIARGVHPFTAGRDHLSHRLQHSGVSIPGSFLLLQGVSVVGAVGAIITSVIMLK
jgi:UDP-GlcNAc:undecaprenyl-phosphate GlcNAc-1-phosphate transferase